MTPKGIAKAFKNPLRFYRRYLQKKAISREIFLEKKKFIQLGIQIIESEESLIKLLTKHMRIYGFRDSSKDKYFAHGIESSQLLSFLILLEESLAQTADDATLVTNNSQYQINKINTPIQYKILRKKESFRIQIKFNSDRIYTFLFQIGDYDRENDAIIFRGNVLYKKIKNISTFNNGFIDLQSLHKHHYKSLFYWDEPVDIVYTWVNGDDPEWRKMLLQYKTYDEIDFDRYRCNDELRYSLRSISKHMSWVRNVYILTNCQPPSWLDTNHKKIHWVWHKNVFPNNKYLPTFNSHSIEACLHKIEGLSEYFIYLNDDIFIMKPTKKQVFFKSNGCSVSFMEPYGMAFHSRSDENEGYINAALNGKKLLENLYGISPVQFHKHTPHALKKSTLEKMEKQFSTSYHTVRSNRFRDKTDISTVSFLYHHYAYQNKESIREGCSDHLIRNTNYLSKDKIIKKRRPSFICINDGGGSHEDTIFKEWMRGFLLANFPKPAPWEKNA